MTINALYKQLSELVKQGHGRKTVCVDKGTFTHPLEDDGELILEVMAAQIARVDMLDEDGNYKELADGTISKRTFLVLRGESEVKP